MTKNIFFKYHKANDHLYELLINRSLFCCSRFELNDPHDGYYVLSESLKREFETKSITKIVQNFKEKGIEISPNAPEVVEAARKFTSEKDFFDLFHNSESGELLNVCSFSEEAENELMWAHYSENFKGVCLEFDFSSMPEISKLLTKVKYTNVTPEISAFTPDEIKNALSTKREAWVYEKEWRILIPDIKKLEFDPHILKAIWFGPKTSPVKINSIMKLCKDNNLKEVKFKRLNIEINGVEL